MSVLLFLIHVVFVFICTANKCTSSDNTGCFYFKQFSVLMNAVSKFIGYLMLDDIETDIQNMDNIKCTDEYLLIPGSICSLNGSQLEIIKPIARGGSGIVYKIQYNDTIYAFKQYIRKNIAYRIREYKTELMVLHELQNISSVIRVYNHEFGPYPCILMEYMEDGDLLDFYHMYNMNSKSIFNMNQIIYIAYQFMVDIGNVLRKLNSLNYMHLDIKVDNILIKKVNKNESLYLKFYLSDFSGVNVNDSVYGGTIQQMTPEQANIAFTKRIQINSKSCIDRYAMYIVLLDTIGHFIAPTWNEVDINSWTYLLYDTGMQIHKVQMEFLMIFTKIEKAASFGIKLKRLYERIFYKRHETVYLAMNKSERLKAPTTNEDIMAFNILHLIKNQVIRTPKSGTEFLNEFNVLDSFPYKCMSWNEWFDILYHNITYNKYIL